MGITPYAWKEVVATVVLGLGLALLSGLLNGWVTLAVLGLTVALLGFYRDPRRRVPVAPGAVLAPADGRVVAVAPAAGADGTPGLRVLIFLSVLDVHINRSPCAGEVLGREHVPGRYRNALSAAATRENERVALTLRPAAPLPGPIVVTQIAGMLARRIVCAVEVGAVLGAGQRFGMIKLGSQTEVWMPRPEGWRACVEVGARVRGGETVLARWQGTDGDDAGA